jgi:hypothetical protein
MNYRIPAVFIKQMSIDEINEFVESEELFDNEGNNIYNSDCHYMVSTESIDIEYLN